MRKTHRTKAEQEAHDHLIQVLNHEAEPLIENDHPYSSLIDNIGDSRFVLLGEASHGTAEFYQARIDISKRLIQEKGFMAIIIEGDFPNTYFIHRYLQGVGDRENNEKILRHFTEFPRWMWQNETVAPFLKWLRDYNDNVNPKEKIGFYGFDLYSLYTSIRSVIDYLSKADPDAALRAKRRYACFDHGLSDPQDYGFLCSEGLKQACTKETLSELIDLHYHASEYLKKDGLSAEDEYFFAMQNARVIKNAENYYRSMFEGRNASWNNRDTHMVETFEYIIKHLEKRSGKPAKVIVWAHNSHLGDARATEMGLNGELNVGQLIRESHDKDSYTVGFSTYDGTVTAASSWGAPCRTKKINPGLNESYEALFHDMDHDKFLLTLRGNKKLEHYLHISRLQRAIGVIYSPKTERSSHYFYTCLPKQFDCIIHFDKTTAVKPLSRR